MPRDQEKDEQCQREEEVPSVQEDGQAQRQELRHAAPRSGVSGQGRGRLPSSSRLPRLATPAAAARAAQAQGCTQAPQVPSLRGAASTDRRALSLPALAPLLPASAPASRRAALEELSLQGCVSFNWEDDDFPADLPAAAWSALPWQRRSLDQLLQDALSFDWEGDELPAEIPPIEIAPVWECVSHGCFVWEEQEDSPEEEAAAEAPAAAVSAAGAPSGEAEARPPAPAEAPAAPHAAAGRRWPAFVRTALRALRRAFTCSCITGQREETDEAASSGQLPASGSSRPEDGGS